MGIDVGDLPRTLRRAWDGVVPPVVELLATAGIIVYLAVPARLAITLSDLESLILILPPESIQKILDFYGLKTLLPLILVITFLVIAHGAGRLVRWLGSLLPGGLAINPTELLYAVAGQWGLRRLWFYHPQLTSLEGIGTLRDIIEEQAERAANNPEAHGRLRNARWARELSWRSSGRIHFMKGLTVVALATWFSAPLLSQERERPTERLAAILLFLILAMLWETRKYIAAEFSDTQSLIDAYIDFKEFEAGSATPPQTDADPKTRQALAEIKRVFHGEIWTLHFRFGRRTDPAVYLVKAVVAYWRTWYPRIRKLRRLAQTAYLKRRGRDA